MTLGELELVINDVMLRHPEYQDADLVGLTYDPKEDHLFMVAESKSNFDDPGDSIYGEISYDKGILKSNLSIIDEVKFKEKDG